jgi:hypothetical protein
LAQTAFVWGEYPEEDRQRLSQALRDAGAVKVTGLGDIRLYECPLRWITAETNAILRMVYLARDSSVLYAAGGWADQPEWFTEAYEIVRLEMIRWEKKKASKGQG